MRNIQIIDDALNCLFEIYAAKESDFALIFPNDQDIEFVDDFIERVGESDASAILERVWRNPVQKAIANGIHGTLFYGDSNLKRRPFFPTKKEAEMVPLPPLTHHE